jgi:hypothetical protein
MHKPCDATAVGKQQSAAVYMWSRPACFKEANECWQYTTGVKTASCSKMGSNSDNLSTERNIYDAVTRTCYYKWIKKLGGGYKLGLIHF